MLHNHPLDQLIHDDSLFFLEAMIPFVDYAYKKPLILLIKYQEIRALMQCFDHPDYVASCGFDCHPESSEEIMECMCRCVQYQEHAADPQNDAGHAGDE